MPAHRLPWIKLWVDARTHVKVCSLTDGQFRTWIYLLWAGSDQRPIRWWFNSTKHAAISSGRPESQIRALIRIGLLDQLDSGVWIHDWKQWQQRYPSDFEDHSRRLSITKEQWTELCAAYGNKCAACGTPAEERPLTADHIRPRSKGGRDEPENIQPLCGPCNSKKHTKTIAFKPPSMPRSMQRSIPPSSTREDRDLAGKEEERIKDGIELWGGVDKPSSLTKHTPNGGCVRESKTDREAAFATFREHVERVNRNPGNWSEIGLRYRLRVPPGAEARVLAAWDAYAANPRLRNGDVLPMKAAKWLGEWEQHEPAPAAVDRPREPVEVALPDGRTVLA